MNFIIIVYFSLQLFSQIYLYFHLISTQINLIALFLAIIASAFYSATHYHNPGYVEFHTNKQNNPALTAKAAISCDLDKIEIPRIELVEEQQKQGKNIQTEDQNNRQQQIVSNEKIQIQKSENLCKITGKKIFPANESISSNDQLIQKKYCRFCKEDQLIRMKHCYECKICVATFDHHCIWVDNCIGEKNRHIFYVYLLGQTIQVSYTFIVLVLQMYEIGEIIKYQIGFVSFLGIILSAVGFLLIFHTYLMLVNLTTWEFMKWDYVYYLINLQSKSKSPFSRGPFNNIRSYWSCAFQKEYKVWQFCESAKIKLTNQID